MRVRSKFISLMLSLSFIFTVTVSSVSDIYAIETKNPKSEESFIFPEGVNVYGLDIPEKTNISDLGYSQDVVTVVNNISNASENSTEQIEEYIEENLTVEQRIERACEEYGIPYSIVISIARLETGWFTSRAYLDGNNPGGLSRNEVPIVFDSVQEGVDRFVSNLANNYFHVGLDTPEKIGEKYCPINPEWASLVRDVMKYGGF